ncbi:unnamed protein product [Rhodiola kirilowii]
MGKLESGDSIKDHICEDLFQETSPLPPPGVPESVVTLVKMVNEATANIPNWDKSS